MMPPLLLFLLETGSEELTNLTGALAELSGMRRIWLDLYGFIFLRDWRSPCRLLCWEATSILLEVLRAGDVLWVKIEVPMVMLAGFMKSGNAWAWLPGPLTNVFTLKRAPRRACPLPIYSRWLA